jgi:hypothetical protein
MEAGVLSLFAGAIVAKAAVDAWFTLGALNGVKACRSAETQASDARGGFLRRLR